MPPLFAFALAAIGAVAVVRWCAKEVRRVNSELDNVRAKAGIDPLDRNSLPKLKRDPNTGEYRPD